MSDWQIACASIAALIARLNTLSVSTNFEDKAEAFAIRREIERRIGVGSIAA